MGNEEESIKRVNEMFLSGIDATDEQIKYLIKAYKDEKTIIGLHNTGLPYDVFFDKGLMNYTSMDKKTMDLSNTVMYSDFLSVLMGYPNGDGKKRGKTCIILKIPKRVFLQQQGIFETLEDGTYGIPPQYISAAFTNGKVIENPAYDKDYYSPNADLCENNTYFSNKKLNVQIFKQEFYGKFGILKKMKGIFNSIFHKRKLIEAPKEEKKVENSFKDKRNKWIKENLYEQVKNAYGDHYEQYGLKFDDNDIDKKGKEKEDF